jgi:ABC-2 type transport system ATP-binding protein
MSIEATNITKLYGRQKALDSVTLDIRPGGITGLLGPNGAGKSTLMKILTCYLPPTAGTAKVCGFDVMEQSIEVRKRVGYLPENNPLYLDLYVREFLFFIAGIEHSKLKSQNSKVKTDLKTQNPLPKHPASGIRHPVSGIRHRINDIISLTGLGPEQHKKLGALSKGYRQRAGLAQALIHDPEVLILDEPTSGLDPNQLLEIRGLIKEIGKEKTVLLSTHIMQEVEAICDRAIIIHQGRIVADDTTLNLRQIATGKTIIIVEFDKATDKRTLLSIDGVHDAFNPASGIWHLISRPGSDIRPSIFQFAVSNGLTVLSMHREEQKLEEVFQELTK